MSTIQRFTSKTQLHKAVNSLVGLIEGIALDGAINATERDFLAIWLSDHAKFRDRHPFNELVPVVETSLADGVLSANEREDLLWLCRRLASDDVLTAIGADLQRLHAICGGIVADLTINESELRGLRDWLEDNTHLQGCWPYDEVGSLINTVLQDGRIDAQEHALLLQYFAEFTALLDDRVIRNPPVAEAGSITGLCAVDPEVIFEGRVFCFTGEAARATKKELEAIVVERGGSVAGGPSKGVNYLVIGAAGNPAWKFACYGRKVERAVQLRREGVRLMIIHEHDFFDAIA